MTANRLMPVGAVIPTNVRDIGERAIRNHLEVAARTTGEVRAMALDHAVLIARNLSLREKGPHEFELLLDDRVNFLTNLIARLPADEHRAAILRAGTLGLISIGDVGPS